MKVSTLRQETTIEEVKGIPDSFLEIEVRAPQTHGKLIGNINTNTRSLNQKNLNQAPDLACTRIMKLFAEQTCPCSTLNNPQ